MRLETDLVQTALKIRGQTIVNALVGLVFGLQQQSIESGLHEGVKLDQEAIWAGVAGHAVLDDNLAWEFRLDLQYPEVAGYGQEEVHDRLERSCERALTEIVFSPMEGLVVVDMGEMVPGLEIVCFEIERPRLGALIKGEYVRSPEDEHNALIDRIMKPDEG
jgi:hypothetical protein